MKTSERKTSESETFKQKILARWRLLLARGGGDRSCGGRAQPGGQRARSAPRWPRACPLQGRLVAVAPPMGDRRLAVHGPILTVLVIWDVRLDRTAQSSSDLLERDGKILFSVRKRLGRGTTVLCLLWGRLVRRG